MVRQSRLTKQKEHLAQAVQAMKTFFTAHELHTQARKKDARLGQATTYRYLKTLVSQNKLHTYTCEKKTLYSTSKDNHVHFSCTRCGTVKHLDIENAAFLKKLPIKSVCHFQLNISGVCEQCTGKTNH